MFVVKRNGQKEKVHFDKITNRIQKLLWDIEDIDAALITQKICSRIYSGISTTELDNLAGQICMGMITENTKYGTLGSRIAISNHQKNTKESLKETIYLLLNNKDETGGDAPLISQEYYDLVCKYLYEH